MLAITGKCRLSLFLQTASSSFTDPTWSQMTRSCSRELTIFNSAMGTKSLTVLLGQPDKRNAFAMLHWFSRNACATFSYRPWMFARLWVLTRLMFLSCCSCCCGWFLCCWPSVRALWSAFTYAFRSAITFLVWTSLLSIFLMTSPLFRTRSANSSTSFSFSASSCARSSFWVC